MPSQPRERSTLRRFLPIPGIAFPLLVLWVALSPFFQSHQGIPVPGGLPSLTYDRALIFAATVMVLLSTALRRSRLRFGLLEALMLIYLISQLLLHQVTAQDPKFALIDYLNVLLLPILAYFLARNLVTTPERLRTVSVGIVAAAIPLALTGFYEHLTGQSLFSDSLLWTDVGTGRAAGPLINPAVYGLALAILIAFAVFLMIQERSTVLRLMALTATVLSSVALFWSYTRSAWLSAAVALGILILGEPRARRIMLPVAVVGVLILVVSWPAIESSEIYQTRIADPQNAYGRVDSFEGQLKILGDSPWIGLGRNVYNIQWRPSNDWVSHNTAMTMLLDGGIAQVLPYVLFVAIIVLASVVTYPRLPARGFRSRAMMCTLWASVAAYGVTTMLIDSTYFIYPNAFFWFTLGLIAALGDSVRDAEPRAVRPSLPPIAWEARQRWQHAAVGAIQSQPERATRGTASIGRHA